VPLPLPEVVSDFKRTIVGQCPLLDQAGEFGLWCPEHKTLGVPERYQFIDKEKKLNNNRHWALFQTGQFATPR
jgi:hypothetical protein